MKNTEQIKSLNTKEFETNKKLQITSFSDLIKFAEEKKEIQLKYDLERNVKLIKFEQGNITINFNENLNKNFIKKLSQCFYEWTGQRWIITLSKENTQKTLHEQKIDKRKNFLSEEKNSEVFREMISKFPDAELVDVEEKDE